MKPENVLLSSGDCHFNGGGGGRGQSGEVGREGMKAIKVAKICDFGLLTVRRMQIVSGFGRYGLMSRLVFMRATGLLWGSPAS